MNARSMNARARDLWKQWVRKGRTTARGKTAQRWKMILLGRHFHEGAVAKLALIAVLSIVAYLYLQPMLYMFTTMLKPLSDLLDPTVLWLPREPTLENIRLAWRGLEYPEAFGNTMLITVSCSLLQMFVCALTGYALARMDFPGKRLLYALVALTFLIPPQVIIVPLYVIYSEFRLLDTPFVFILPAMSGQGLRSALFILIFSQFFRTLPVSLEEAAKLDGASLFRLFFRIMLPVSRSACLVVFLFSFIWYWNMSYEPAMFMSNSFTPLSIRLNGLDSVLYPGRMFNLQQDVDPVTEGAKMAAGFLIVLPPLLLYMIAQRWFVQSVERSGMVE